MRYAFFGTPRFAEFVLRKLVQAGYPPAVLVCNPDRPVGRKQVIVPSEAKQYVKTLNEDIAVLQPEKLDVSVFDGEFDIFIVAAYGKIIPKEVLELPKQGTIGVHPSLLPKYRGATPIRSAILGGETETGISIFKVDHGPVYARRTVSISGRSCPELLEVLAKEGAHLLIEILPDILLDELEPQPQEHDAMTMTKKFETDDAKVEYIELKRAVSGDDPETAKKIERIIRALNPEPGAWTVPEDSELNIPKGKRTKLLRARIENNALVLERIHVAGKKPRDI